MPAPDEPQVTLARVGGGRSRTLRTWAALAAVAAVSVTIVGAGFLGGGTPRPSPAPTRAVDGADRPTPSRGAAATAPARATGRIIAPPNAGYEVDYARDGSHRPIVTQGGALAIFGFGERVPDGTYPGVISVAVGTPARGAPIPFDGQNRSVYGTTLDELAASYFGGEDRIPAVRSAFGVDGTLGLLLDFDAFAPGTSTRSVALIAHGNRAYVLESVGFDGLFPGLRNAASAGLVRFLAGLRFTDPLFVSPALGVQAIAPDGLDAQPAPADAVVFTAPGTAPGFSRALSIAAWTPQRGAVLRLLTRFAERQDAWVSAGSAAAVEEHYLGARPGAILSRTPLRIGGFDGEIVEQEGEPTMAFVVRGDRAYVFSWASVPLGHRLEEFWMFLETVAFFGE